MDWTIILFWLSVGSAIILVAVLGLSMFHGFDFHGDLNVEINHDVDGADHSDTDQGNALGYFKGTLVFIAFGAWMARAMLLKDFSWPVALLVGGASGYAGIFLLGKVLSFLLKQTSEGNWKHENAIGQMGEVYLRIPENGVGQIQVTINGGLRTVDAIAHEGTIESGKKVAVLGVDGQNRLLVTAMHLPNTDGEFERLVKLQEPSLLSEDRPMKIN